MSSKDAVNQATIETIFRDPVSYLSAFGIEAEIVAETTLPAAA